MEDLNNTINHFDIYKVKHQQLQNTFFSSTYSYVQEKHVLSHKTSLNTFKRNEIM